MRIGEKMVDIDSIIDGYEDFKEKKFSKYKKKFYELVKEGQKPKILFISCCDSRVVPNLITNTDPGDMFIVRNVGNFIPPHSPDDKFHSTAAAIEYAVSHLKVSEIIVCGHSHCGAIHELYKDNNDHHAFVHITKWLELGAKAKNYVNLVMPDATLEKKLVATEKISVFFQLTNLLTYPEVKKRVDEGKLNLRGWYYKIQSGELEYFDNDAHKFIPLKSE